MQVIRAILASALCLGVGSCALSQPRASGDVPRSSAVEHSASEARCQLVRSGFGPAGAAPLRVEVVVSGLEIPWSLAFVPGTRGDFLVSERPGRIRLVRSGVLVPEPVAVVPASADGDEGLLGIAIDPRFPATRYLYAYYTTRKGDRKVNRVTRFAIDDALAGRDERVLFDDIPASPRHDGGRIRFGPDGMLYVATGDASVPDHSPDASTPAGKILRLTPEGATPADNPRPASAVFVSGVRNVQAFDWLDDGRLVIADHGPSGELGRKGHDEVSVARAGDDLGWPGTWGCASGAGKVTPLLVFEDAAPPGGGVYYRGDAIPAWKGSFLVATLASKHLHRFAFDADARRVTAHEVYLEGDPPRGFGRLRDVVTGPDGALYVTTSNCDALGACPDAKDAVLRVTAAASAGPRPPTLR